MRKLALLILMMGASSTTLAQAGFFRDVRSLSEPVNGKSYEAAPTVSDDGLIICFGRALTGGLGPGGWDLYTATRSSTDPTARFS